MGLDVITFNYKEISWSECMFLKTFPLQEELIRLGLQLLCRRSWELCSPPQSRADRRERALRCCCCCCCISLPNQHLNYCLALEGALITRFVQQALMKAWAREEFAGYRGVCMPIYPCSSGVQFGEGPMLRWQRWHQGTSCPSISEIIAQLFPASSCL